MNPNQTRSVLPPKTDNDTSSPAVEATAARPASSVSEPNASQTVARPPASGSASGFSGPVPASGTDAMPIIDGYVVLKKIGEGGMGAVYLAEDSRLGRKAAIKTMRRELAAPADRDRFVREARAAAAVEHDNIVPVWQVGEAADGTAFIAMPFLQGEMLDDRLKRDRGCGLGVLLKVAREVADGLAAAHSKGLIHRDIKPGNIWIEGDRTSTEAAEQFRRCKILDFGLARSTGADDAQITASGAILGTPAYMAPEQARGERVDHRADLFSLGVMLYRMATGRMPFRGPNAMAVLIALTTETPPPVGTLAPNLPPALAELIDRLMSKEATARPQSAKEVSAAVRQIAKDAQAKKSAPQRPEPKPDVGPITAAWEEVTEEETAAPVAKASVPAKRRRAPWFIAGGVLAALAVAAAAAFVLRVQTANGTLVVEINDPAVEARIKNGKLVLADADGKDRYTITPADRDTKINAGAYTIRVEGADGLALDTREFTLKKGEQVTVRVTLAPTEMAKKPDAPKIEPPKDEPPKDVPKIEPLTDTDRVAAEWVLAVGGTVHLTSGQMVTAAADLPPGRVRLLSVWLDNNSEVSDEKLALFKDCRQISGLFIHSTATTDAGLAHLAGLRELHDINLCGTNITNAGLVHLKELPLLNIYLGATQLTNEGLKNLPNLANLTKLVVTDTNISDDGLEALKNCRQLARLYLSRTEVKAAGVAALTNALPGCRIQWDEGIVRPRAVADPDRRAAISVLSVGGTITVDGRPAVTRQFADIPKDRFRLTGVNFSGVHLVDDLAAEFLADCSYLTHADLRGVLLSDQGLLALSSCAKLQTLDARQTHVTAAGVAALAKALPACKIEWDGGIIEPKAALADPNRRAAEYVLSVGGTVGVTDVVPGGRVKNISDAKDLPKDPFHVAMVSILRPNPLLTDAGMAAFDGCTHITTLTIHNRGVTDAGLAHFKGCSGLKVLDLNCLQVTDAGMAHFKDCKELVGILLTITPVADAGLAHFKGCTKLESLVLSRTKVTNAGLVNFKNCNELKLLSLETIQVSDDGMANFMGCKSLVSLNLSSTKVTDAGLENFRLCTQLTSLQLSFTQISDTGVAYFKDCKGLTQLQLGGTQVTDASLAILKGCSKLSTFDLTGTKVTAKGVSDFTKAVPACQVFWDKK